MCSSTPFCMCCLTPQMSDVSGGGAAGRVWRVQPAAALMDMACSCKTSSPIFFYIFIQSFVKASEETKTFARRRVFNNVASPYYSANWEKTASPAHLLHFSIDLTEGNRGPKCVIGALERWHWSADSWSSGGRSRPSSAAVKQHLQLPLWQERHITEVLFITIHCRDERCRSCQLVDTGSLMMDRSALQVFITAFLQILKKKYSDYDPI